MLKIAVVLLSGITFGALLRKHPVNILPKIIGHLHDLGLEALVLTLAGLAGSIGTAFALWKYANRRTDR